MPDELDSKTLVDLALAEAGLDELASRLPNPVGQPDLMAVVGAAFGSRARDLYAGFLYAIDGPSVIAPLVLARPLIELAILLRWIRDDVEPRHDLWQAHSAEMEAKAIRQAAAHLPRPVGDPYHIDELGAVLAEKDVFAAAGRKRANRLGTERALPGLTEMIQSVEKRSEAEGHALGQAYDIAFRFVSPATHSDDSSFRMNFVEKSGSPVQYAERSIVDPDHLRLIAAGCMAHAIESAARMCLLDALADTALSIRKMLVAAAN